MINELEIDIRSIEEWRALQQAYPVLFKQETGDRLCAHVARHGLTDPMAGRMDPETISIATDNYRETVLAEGLNTRQRAVLLCLQNELVHRDAACPVYASEAVSPLARRLKKVLDGFVGSEYLPSVTDRLRHPTLMHQNIQAFSFDDASFDIYLSCDVLEHIPDLRLAINEAARILKPGGVFMGTVPFAGGHTETIVLAELTDNGINHLEEPQYHGNPTRPEEGSLVFQIPAWDMLDMCRDAGFSDACMKLVLSQKYGIFSQTPGFVIMFYAVR